MNLISTLCLSSSLSIDSFALTASNCTKKLSKMRIICILIIFSTIQTALLMAGYYLSSEFADFLSKYSKYIALAILSIIGFKMIYEAYPSNNDKSEHSNNKNIRRKKLFFVEIILAGLGSSLDACGVGFSIATLDTSIYSFAIATFFTTFVFCTLGAFLGGKIGGKLQKKAEFIAGLVLILIGFKIFAS